MSSLTQSPAWRALSTHAGKVGSFKIADLASDQNRNKRLIHTLEGLTFDFSKNLVSSETLDFLNDLAVQQNANKNIARMMDGEKINVTENAAAWHTALRDPNPPAEVRDTLARMKQIAETIRADQSIRSILHIGIGGSDLGSRLVYSALGHDGPAIHFVTNVDPYDLQSAIAKCDPKSTLVIGVTKSFTTQETLFNFKTARAWLNNDARLYAVTANTQAAKDAGVKHENILRMWDWVGGRFSVWSAVGLSLAISCGFDNFAQFLQGAHKADIHARTAPLDQNIPALMALLSVWYGNFLNATAHGVLPYSTRLAPLPGWLQQVEMEAGGKRVDLQGQLCDYATAGIVFGTIGTNAQHAFMQLVHQGTHTIPCDFIGVQGTDSGQRALMANLEAQTLSLMTGNGNVAPHLACPGNRPSSTIILPRLDAGSLGVLMAVYEHKTAIQGFVWNINSFDQFGVELGKTLAKERLARK